MSLVNIFGRKWGADDISLGRGSYVYVDANGVVRTVPSLNASYIVFVATPKTIEDLVDGGKDVTIYPLNIDAGGSVTVGTGLTVATSVVFSAMNVAGLVRNTAAGVLSGGYSLLATDLPTGIDAAKLADGSVSDTELQYINSVTSNVQDQIDTIVAGALPTTLYALLQDQKAQGTHGGTFTSGAWRTRDINTEVSDANAIVTIAANQFTLQAGTYRISASAPAYTGGTHRIKLYNITDAADEAGCLGTSEYYGTPNRSFLGGAFTIAGAKVFEIRHYTSSTTATYGFGYAANIAGYVEIYTQVEIWKVG